MMSSGIIDVDNDSHYHDQLMSGNDSGEDMEEVEALIKQRIKQGSGRDYDSIIKKDLIAYKKNNDHHQDMGYS